MTILEHRLHELERALLMAQHELECQMRSPKTADHKEAERERDTWKLVATRNAKQRDEWERTCRDAWKQIDALRASR
jgi:hypothetical protein